MAKILAFTDPHGEITAAEMVVSKAREEAIDAIVCSGDLTYFGKTDGAFFDELASMEREIYIIPGNHESAEAWTRLCIDRPFLIDVTFRRVRVGDIDIGGVPGNDLAFWPGSSRVESDVLETTITLLGNRGGSRKLVLLSHYPPAKTGIDGTMKPTPDSGGSLLVRRLVETIQPEVCVAGHYHQSFGGTDRIGDTRLLNPGPYGSIVTL